MPTELHSKDGAMPYQCLRLEQDGMIATVTLERPDAANSINLELAQELLQAAQACDDPGVRAVILTGSGGTFSSGGDLKEFVAQGERVSAHLREVTVPLHAALVRFARLNAPVITAVNGVAAGAGMSLACAGDLVLAAESARFTMAYTRVGLSPDGSGTWFIPRLIGHRRAMELALTNRVLSATEAAEWGLVNRVVSDLALMTEAEALARDFAHGPSLAYGATKRLLVATWTNSLEAQLELESRSIAQLGESSDGREGIAAFTEKRKAEFQGR